MADRSYKAFVVEGEAREPLIIKNISYVFFKYANFEICLMNRKNVIDYDFYINEITPYEIYCMEKCEIEQGKVFTLSAFPEFLLDYHGIRLWNSCVKHTRNKLHEVYCSKRLYVN